MGRKAAGIFSVLLCLCLLLTACAAQEPEQTLPERKTLQYQGERYVLREGVTSMLLMGLDQYHRPEEQKGYTNDLQADFFLLLVLDENSQSLEALHLNRDTMTEIRRLGIGGGVADKFQGQLALAHTYGSGGSDSCLNAVKAVSTLLQGVPIDHYVSLTMDAVAAVNDLAGGVTVTVLDDFSQVDPALVKGEEVTLRGAQALTYVRARRDLDDSTNLGRMERQRQYLEALWGQLQKKAAREEGFLEEALPGISDGFVSDCTVNQLEALLRKMGQYSLGSIRDLKGRSVVGEEYMEFYPDGEDLLRQTLELFWEKEN